MKVDTTNKALTKRVLFDKENVMAIQQDMQLSNKNTKTLLRDIRIATRSRKSVESKVYKNLLDTYQLDKFFNMRQLMYRFEDKDTKLVKHHEQPTVVCNNLPGLIDKIIETRKQVENESLLIKISIDGGGGFLKVCLSLFDINDPFPKLSSSSMLKRFKDSGVKRIFIIGIVPKVSEDYVNVKRLWINIGIHVLQKKYTIATDLKLCNVLLGMMSPSSCHPCVWCDITKGNLSKKGKP